MQGRLLSTGWGAGTRRGASERKEGIGRQEHRRDNNLTGGVAGGAAPASASAGPTNASGQAHAIRQLGPYRVQLWQVVHKALPGGDAAAAGAHRAV